MVEKLPTYSGRDIASGRIQTRIYHSEKMAKTRITPLRMKRFRREKYIGFETSQALPTILEARLTPFIGLTCVLCPSCNKRQCL